MTVSVVVPTKDRWSSVVRLLRSLADQEIGPLEVIVVDDGSSAIAPEPLVERGLPVRVIRTRSTGRASARNHGASLARAEVLLFLDDDMEVARTFVAGHIEARQAATDIVTGPTPLPTATLKTSFGRFRGWLDTRSEPAASTGLREVDGLTGANMSIFRSTFERVGGFDVRLTNPGCEDFAFHLGAKSKGCRTLFAPGLPAIHHDEFLDLRSYGRRYRVYTSGWVQLIALEPEVLHRAPRFKALCLANDLRLRSLLTPARRPLIAAKVLAERVGALPVLYGVAGAFEVVAAPDRLLWPLYLRILSLEARRGYREGIERYLDGALPPGIPAGTPRIACAKKQ